TLVFDFGIIGEHSYAKDVQVYWHKMFGSEYPNGWKNQISTEVLFLAGYGYKLRIWDWERRGLSSDLVFHSGLGIGNFRTYANTGVELRFGWNLKEDFGSFLNRPGRGILDAGIYEKHPRHFSIYGFIVTDLQAILHDVTLDGGFFSRSSHTVAKKPFVANLMAGMRFECDYFRLILSGVYETRRFEKQGKPHRYASVVISVPFGFLKKQASDIKADNKGKRQSAEEIPELLKPGVLRNKGLKKLSPSSPVEGFDDPRVFEMYDNVRMYVRPALKMIIDQQQLLPFPLIDEDFNQIYGLEQRVRQQVRGGRLHVRINAMRPHYPIHDASVQDILQDKTIIWAVITGYIELVKRWRSIEISGYRGDIS
ncbi:MAG: lipid A deacylase LpxR family protein, partial [Candidatus Omnitrophica bacterium]|nr:lipid A deacylase LpxR family protein [Candidatus Omnitrophota bacterium]